MRCRAGEISLSQFPYPVFESMSEMADLYPHPGLCPYGSVVLFVGISLHVIVWQFVSRQESL